MKKHQEIEDPGSGYSRAVRWRATLVLAGVHTQRQEAAGCQARFLGLSQRGLKNYRPMNINSLMSYVGYSVKGSKNLRWSEGPMRTPEYSQYWGNMWNNLLKATCLGP
jgi:hypothetical protein